MAGDPGGGAADCSLTSCLTPTFLFLGLRFPQQPLPIGPSLILNETLACGLLTLFDTPIRFDVADQPAFLSSLALVTSDPS